MMALRTFAGPMLSVALAVACGGSEGVDDSTVEGANQVRSTAESPCDILGRLVPEVVAVADPSAITFEPGGGTNPYCEATWRRPDAEELEAAQAQAMTDYMLRRMEATRRGEAFDEPMPTARVDGTIMLTIAAAPFQDDAAAVAALETVIGRLAEGIAVETDEASATFQSNYDQPVSGVGAGAAWSTQMSQISVAAHRTLFHLTVRVHDNGDDNREVAEELARAIVEEL